MPKDNQPDPRNSFATRYLPWLLGGVMFLVYGITLNHWVTLLNLNQVAAVSGWTWRPQVYNPLSFLVTLPLRLIPTALIPIALNLFSALCAAVTLVVLARTVAILPHDRTEMERLRERSDFSFLTGWVAWFPPVMAVIFAGFQLAFWENATSYTNESLELLWFALILWQLLEYRLDEREGRLFVAAFLYGSGLAESWALIGFIPVFLMMIIWLRRLSFFDLRFLQRMIVCGLCGMLLFLLLPVLANFSDHAHGAFWRNLKANLQIDWMVLKFPFQRQDIRHDLGLISLTSLLPAFLVAIRWSSSFGDSSRIGAMLVHYMMHAVNAVLLGVLLWVTFDPPFSPRYLLQDMGIPTPGLTYYYIVALCAGYYFGYFMLVFGKAAAPTRRNPRPDPALPKPVAWLCPIILICVISLTAIGACLLIYKNTPAVRNINDDSLLKFAQFTAQGLPRDGAILLCDSDQSGQDQPIRAFMIQAVLARNGVAQNYPVVNTFSLNFPAYHTYLHKHFPKIWPETVSTNDTTALNPLRIYLTLNQLSKSNSLYYLHPSFGYYFEQFYQEPHGLTYALKPLPNTTVLPPALDKTLTAENESFWTHVLADAQPVIEKDLHPPDAAQQPGIVGWLMMHLHVSPEPNPNAMIAGEYYSHGINYFGVQIQRAGELDKAASFFKAAVNLNSNNVVAAVNLEFNKTLRAGSSTTVDLSRATADQFGKYRDWNAVLNANGPFDETSFCFAQGVFLMQASLMRQAAVPFNRVRELVPDNLAARLFLAQIYIFNRLPDQALETLHDPLTRPFRFALTEFNSTELNVLAASAHFQRNENTAAAALLETEMDRHPDDETLLLVSAQAFNMHGMFTNALHVINRKLARSPDEPSWLFGKGFVSLQIGAYDDAIASLSRLLTIQTNNVDALYNRGVAYFQSGQLDAAHADFAHFQSVFTNNLQVAYSLGEIAWRQHDTNEAIRNYKILTTYAPTNVPELKTVRQRLSQLTGK